MTVAEYADFVQAGHGAPRNWEKQLPRLDHPVVWVSWDAATALVDGRGPTRLLTHCQVLADEISGIYRMLGDTDSSYLLRQMSN